MLILVNILFFVEKNAVKRSAQCEYKLRTVIGSLLKFPIKTRYKNYLGYRTQTAGPPNIIRRDAFLGKNCDNAIPMLNDDGKFFLFFPVYLSAVCTCGKWLARGYGLSLRNRQNRCTIKKSVSNKKQS